MRPLSLLLFGPKRFLANATGAGIHNEFIRIGNLAFFGLAH